MLVWISQRNPEIHVANNLSIKNFPKETERKRTKSRTTEEQQAIQENIPKEGIGGENLTVIGSTVDLGRQAFVLAARKMVALENGLLTQH